MQTPARNVKILPLFTNLPNPPLPTSVLAISSPALVLTTGWRIQRQLSYKTRLMHGHPQKPRRRLREKTTPSKKCKENMLPRLPNPRFAPSIAEHCPLSTPFAEDSTGTAPTMILSLRKPFPNEPLEAHSALSSCPNNTRKAPHRGRWEGTNRTKHFPASPRAARTPSASSRTPIPSRHTAPRPRRRRDSKSGNSMNDAPQSRSASRPLRPTAPSSHLS